MTLEGSSAFANLINSKQEYAKFFETKFMAPLGRKQVGSFALSLSGGNHL